MWLPVCLLALALCGCGLADNNPTAPTVHCFNQTRTLDASSGDTTVRVTCPTNAPGG